MLLPPRVVWQPWLFSRLLIWVAMGLLAPNLPTGEVAKQLGWHLFLLGDGHWYARIATSGYWQDAVGQYPSIAFFPLYPLVCSFVMQLGQMPFIFAGLLVNNVAFLVALTILHRWVAAQWHPVVAKWTVIAIAWFPLSIVGTLADADGLFLLLNVLTLQGFSRGYYGLAGITGALVAATRSLGVSLLPTLVSVAWQQRRGEAAYWAAGVTLIGFVMYSLLCAVWFGDLFAFDRALTWLPQRPPALLDWAAWGNTLLAGIVGPLKPETGELRSIWFPIQFCLIEIGFFLIWRFKERIAPVLRPWLIVLLALWFWLLWPLGLVRTVTVLGGLYLFWTSRSKLGVLLTNYTFWSLLWLAFSQNPLTPERGFYAIVGLPIGLGLWLAKRPLWRMPMIVGFGFALLGTAILVAQGQLAL